MGKALQCAELTLDKSNRAPGILANAEAKTEAIDYLMKLTQVPTSISAKIRCIQALVYHPLVIQTGCPELLNPSRAKKRKLSSAYELERRANLIIREEGSNKAMILTETQGQNMKAAIFENVCQLKAFSDGNQADHVVGIATTQREWAIISYSRCLAALLGPEQNNYEASRLILQGEFTNEDIEEMKELVISAQAEISLGFVRDGNPLN